MSLRQELVRRARTIVVKVGTNVLSTDDDRLDSDRIATLAEQIRRLVESGRKVVLVSSGAIGAGMGLLGLRERPKDLSHLQAAAATGQAHLIHLYDKHLRPHGFHAAQLLLTANDFKSRSRYLNVRNTLLTLAEFPTVPIVNENDTVSTEEIKLGDNDRLAAMVANLIRADLLIVLSVVDGLLTGDPTDAASRRIPLVERFDEELMSLVGASKSSRGTGGMRTKLEAVQTATAVGTNVMIANGKCPQILDDIFAGEDVGTLFLAEQEAVPAWKRWIGYTLPPKGKLVLDDGTGGPSNSRGSLCWRSECPRWKGISKRGRSCRWWTCAGEEFARGLTNYDARTASQVAGKRAEEITALLGAMRYDEVIHRDNLVVRT